MKCGGGRGGFGQFKIQKNIFRASIKFTDQISISKLNLEEISGWNNVFYGYVLRGGGLFSENVTFLMLRFRCYVFDATFSISDLEFLIKNFR